MSVCKMKKLTVLAHKRDTDALLSRLMRLRAVELRQEEGEELTPVFSDLQGKRAELERKIQAVDSALSALRKYGKKKGLGAKPIPLDLDAFSKNSSNKQAEELVNEALSLESEKAKCISDTALSQTKLASLEAWRDYDLELGFSGTEKTEVILGSLPGGTELSRIDGEIAEYGGFAEIVNDSDTTCLLSVTYLRENEADVMRGLTRLGFVKASFEDSATAKEAIGRTKARLREIEIRLEKIDDRLKKIAESTDLIECYYDLLATSARQSEAKMQLLGTENCTVLCGWVPEQRQETVERALSKFECAYEMTDPDEEDEPPVLLKNNPISRSFEWVMGMYAYPKYGTYDPTVIMSLFYVIIFGLMFADVGYGAILVVACFGGILLLNPREGMRNFLAMFGYCGIFCIIGGILFGAYFGNIPQAFMENHGIPYNLAGNGRGSYGCRYGGSVLRALQKGTVGRRALRYSYLVALLCGSGTHLPLPLGKIRGYRGCSFSYCHPGTPREINFHENIQGRGQPLRHHKLCRRPAVLFQNIGARPGGQRYRSGGKHHEHHGGTERGRIYYDGRDLHLRPFAQSCHQRAGNLRSYQQTSVYRIFR